MPLSARCCTFLISYLLTTAEAPARSAAAKTFSPVKKIAGVFKGLVSIMAADVTRWQTAQVSRWAEAQ